MSTTRWILAFDSSCGRCRRISASVAQACAGKLEVLPLAHPDVARWRTMSLGPDPRWAPTLLGVSEGRVRGWTGLSMAGPLIRALGPRSTINVLRALGGQRREIVGNDGESGAKGVLDRALLQFGSGLLLAGGLVLSGMLSAGPDPARSWVKDNLDRLPQNYDDFVVHSMDYRRAIYQELSAATRSALWAEQLRRYRTAHTNLSTAQIAVLDTASDIVAKESNFAGAPSAGSNQDEQFRNTAQQAFGHAEAAKIFATLGPLDELSPTNPAAVGCQCSAVSSWCGGGSLCRTGHCIKSPGCGTLYRYLCDGLCP